MNRTDRLYALVEELRGVAPRMRSARWLAERFAVSIRTIERDLAALQEAGVPIWAESGRAGGYTLDASATLPPASFTADEALALLVGLGRLRGGPLGSAATTAMRKLLAVMPDEEARRATVAASRIHLLEPEEERPPVVPELAASLRSDRVIRLAYRDRAGEASTRDVEPLGSIVKGDTWYLIGWCRLRDGVRAFRGDRIVSIELTDERPPRRTLSREDLDIPFGTLRPVVDELR